MPTSATQTSTGGSARRVVLLLYYLAVLCGLVVLYGRGELATSGFIYQAF